MTQTEVLSIASSSPLLNLDRMLRHEAPKQDPATSTHGPDHEAGIHAPLARDAGLEQPVAAATAQEPSAAAAPSQAAAIAPAEPGAQLPVQELSADGRKAFFLMRREAPEAYLQQFRQLRSRLFRFQETLGRQRVDCRSLLVTSPSAGEGKSFVASNLALMMAVAPQCRILLADCNVHRPSFPERFHLREGAGLRNALAGAPWQSVSRRLKGTNLFVTGLGTQTSSSQEPLDYNKLKSWMDDVKKDFQWIILDGTSLEESPDAEMLSYATDRTLLVVRKGQTRFEEMDRCLSKIDDSLLAGVVFNQ